jgi:Amt family ammonium transporter
MKLWAFLAFASVMTAFIYPLQGSWTWGGNAVFGLYELNFTDYAGSGIVHMAGACAAVAGVLLLGPRKGKYGPNGTINAIPGANLPMATLGTFILWLGWFGFNGGSTLSLDSISAANEVALVFVNTNAAAAGGLLGALILARLMFGKADLTMALNGALAGLVSITAEPADPTPLLATLIGAVGGALAVVSILVLDKLRLDDPVGAISVHGTAGIWGIFAVLLSDAEATFIGQLVGMLTIMVWMFGASLLVWFILKLVMGLRVSEEDEFKGSDLAECGMEAYPEFTSGK